MACDHRGRRSFNEFLSFLCFLRHVSWTVTNGSVEKYSMSRHQSGSYKKDGNGTNVRGAYLTWRVKQISKNRVPVTGKTADT